MRLLRRILQATAAALALGVYVWFAAVRNVARVKRRKALRRRVRATKPPAKHR
jgi:HAMP domain-containing protein